MVHHRRSSLIQLPQRMGRYDRCDNELLILHRTLLHQMDHKQLVLHAD